MSSALITWNLQISTQTPLLIDRQAVIVALAESKAVWTFGDYACESIKPQSWLRPEKDVGRTCLLSGGPMTIRTLPIQWDNFMAYADNKDLACFLSQHLIPTAPPDNRH